MTSKQKPKVIFFDAVGTLFGVKGSVGEVYSNLAHQSGVEVAADQLQIAFNESFKVSRPPVFPGVDSQQIPDREFDWWKHIVEETFKKAGVYDQFEDFEGFFTKVYAHFATPKPWEIYQDVLPALKQWHQQGIELGIISNFDTRLYALLELLDLKQYFTSITISSTVGAAKPDSKIFITALQKHNCLPQEAWYIGDNMKEDYQAAKAVGLQPFLIERPQKVPSRS